MPRKPIKSRKKLRPVLTPCMRYFLETGDHLLRGQNPLPREKFEIFMFGKRSDSTMRKLKKVWEIHKAEIMRQWKAEKRRGLPWSAKVFDTNKKGDHDHETFAQARRTN